MVFIISSQPTIDGDAMVMKAQVDTEAELSTDVNMRTCAPTSEVVCSDLSFYANKKNDGTWNIVSMS